MNAANMPSLNRGANLHRTPGTKDFVESVASRKFEDIRKSKQSVMVMKYPHDSKLEEDVTDSMRKSTDKHNMFTSQSDGDMGNDKDVLNLEQADRGHQLGNNGNRSIRKRETDIQSVSNYVDGLIESMEAMKSDLVKVRYHVEKYRVDSDKQRLNCKTKELEAILLKNENICLREELDRLRHTGQNVETNDDGYSQLKHVSNHSIPDSHDDTTSRAESKSSDTDVICRSKYPTLAPILKPKIYRRPQLAIITDSFDSLHCSGNGNLINTEKYGNLESQSSQSWNFTGNAGTICEAEISMSAPNMGVDDKSSANNNCNNNEIVKSNKTF